MSELTPVEIVGYEVCEAGSPLALDNGSFTAGMNGHIAKPIQVDKLLSILAEIIRQQEN